MNAQLIARVDPKLRWKLQWITVAFKGRTYSFPLRYRDLGEYVKAQYLDARRNNEFTHDGNAEETSEPWGGQVFLEEEAGVRARNPNARIIALQMYSDATQVGG